MSLIPVHHHVLPAIQQSQIAETALWVMIWYEAVHFYKRKDLFYFYLWLVVCRWPWKPEESVRSSGARVQTVVSQTVQVLGSKHGSWKTASFLNGWAISLALKFPFIFKTFVCVCMSMCTNAGECMCICECVHVYVHVCAHLCVKLRMFFHFPAAQTPINTQKLY